MSSSSSSSELLFSLAPGFLLNRPDITVLVDWCKTPSYLLTSLLNDAHTNKQVALLSVIENFENNQVYAKQIGNFFVIITISAGTI